MERTRIEEFSKDGKNFVYIDCSDIKTNEEFAQVIKKVLPVVEKYPPNSLYTITNIEKVRFDSETKELTVQYLEDNKPYVKYGAVIGIDGIKKVFASTLFKLSERKNLFFAFTKENAIELLLKQK